MFDSFVFDEVINPGNVNIGDSKEILIANSNQLLLYIGYPRTLNALKYLNEEVPE